MNEIFVIGMDAAGSLPARALERIERAEGVLASRRLMFILEHSQSAQSFMEKIIVMDRLEDIYARLRDSQCPMAVIASGDPLFFGIGSKIIEAVPGAVVEIIPAISSVQLAFARLGLPWHDAFFLSLHGGGKRRWSLDDLPLLAERHEKMAILTGGENTPAHIASFLPAGSKVHVFERLGHDDERHITADPVGLSGMQFREPNIMIVLNQGITCIMTGLTESDFQSQGGLITKDEVRAVSLHKLRLPLSGVLWDVGAGSGSVSIEARRLCPGLEVYAIEKDPARILDIKSNASSNRAGTIHAVEGTAPESLLGLPSPDRVFIGGSAGRLSEIVGHALSRMTSGTILINAITIEALNEAVSCMKAHGMSYQITSLSVGRSREIGQGMYLKAENQVFLIRGEK